MNRLNASQVDIGYRNTTIIKELDVQIRDGKVTSIIGPNGCGKSTLLKALSRLIEVKKGEVLLDNQNIQHQSTKEVAKKIAILPQTPTVTDSITAVSYTHLTLPTILRV